MLNSAEFSQSQNICSFGIAVERSDFQDYEPGSIPGGGGSGSIHKSNLSNERVILGRRGGAPFLVRSVCQENKIGLRGIRISRGARKHVL